MTAERPFGEQRLVLAEYGAPARLLFRLMGLADPAHYLHARYVERMLRHLRRPATRILDAGCGRGDFAFWLARRFPGAQVLGIDIDADRIARNRAAARQLGIHNAAFEVADVTRSSTFGAFDLILSVDVLEHVPNQEGAFRELASALAAGGLLVIHMPTVRVQPVLFDSHLGAFHQWLDEEHAAPPRTADEVVGLIRSSGLEVEATQATFGRYSGELATSLFNLAFAPSARNRVVQAALAIPCRLLALADQLGWDGPRYAVALAAHRPGLGG